jgi:phosphoribosylanthranilate isomerase
MADEVYPQVKVCGLTTPEQAAACATLGADAIGLVFYPPSPRHVDAEQARAIVQALPPNVPAVGVFVDPQWPLLEFLIIHCGLRGIQLHGNEPAGLIVRLQKSFAVTVIKSLFAHKAPDMNAAARYAPDAFLVECGRGPLPGGNAQTWNWSSAEAFARRKVTLLAGGLTPDNVAEAVAACRPDAVDASSGLESAPGRKDLGKVARFIETVRRCADFYRVPAKSICPIFGDKGGVPLSSGSKSDR